MIDEHDLRRHLRARAESYGPADQLRADVRRRLETLDTSTSRPLFTDDRRSRRPSSALLVAATVGCLMLAVGGLFLLTRGGEPDRLTTDLTSSATTLPGSDTSTPSTSEPSVDRTTFESTQTNPLVRFDLPDDPATSLISESIDSIEFRLDAPAGDGRLVILLPPLTTWGRSRSRSAGSSHRSRRPRSIRSTPSWSGRRPPRACS